MAKKVDHAGVAAILAERGIVGMIEGRTEVGPRALGHRSLLAYPASNEVKDKLNQLKVRQWYRPSAREQSKAKRASERATRESRRPQRPGGAALASLSRLPIQFVCGVRWTVALRCGKCSGLGCNTARHVATQCVAAEAVGRWTLLAPV
jgi:hypothetical protein